MATNGKLRVRDLHQGMGIAVAERTVLRKDEQGNFETWGDVATRVATGNASLDPRRKHQEIEQALMERLIASGGLLMSGRHLQHGDVTQPTRNMEIFTNCATAATSFLSFLLLLNGSGVGRSYDDDMMLVNWDDSPTVWCVLDEGHADYDHSKHLSARNARHMYGHGRDVMWFEVPDDREGWAKALEMVEVAAFERVHKDKLLLLDFSEVRCKGTPIKGMQDRPASGPVPLMNAFAKAMMIRGAGLPRWLQAMFVDHVFAECVLVGGARRAAKWCGKHWRDPTVLDFIRIKRPIEYQGKTMDEVIAYRKALVERGDSNPTAFLWSGNNSVLVDEDFWAEADEPGTWANQVFTVATECAYADGTGEPAFVNVDKLVQKDEGWGGMHLGDYVGSDRYQVQENTQGYLARLAKRAIAKKHYMIVNPCVTGDTVIATLDGPKTFEELAEDGRDVLIHAWHPDTKLPVVRWMRRPHRTRREVRVLEVEFDSGLRARMTHDHSLYTFRGKKVQAKNLRIGQSVRAFSMSQHRDGQLRAHAWDAKTDSARHQWVHRMVWENAYGILPDGVIVHHKNGDPLDNRLENLESMTARDHNVVHYPERYAAGFDGTAPNHKVMAVRSAGRADVYNGCVDDAHTYIILDPDPTAGIMSGVVSANCGEIAISLLGGYCTLACTAPYLLRPEWGDDDHAWHNQDTLDRYYVEWDNEFEVSVRVAVRATIRVNLMDSIYGREVRRTNRIGPGLTGIHEWMWSRFGLTFTEAVATPMTDRSRKMWGTLSRMSQAAYDEAERYSKAIGVVTPHTGCTIPPAGTISKFFGLTEGAHLPSQAAYLRWVQFRDDDPLVEVHRDSGYPVRVLKDYKGHTIVGFPTQPVITEIMPEDLLVVAPDASMEDQYRWLELLEHYWIEGRPHGIGESRGNQVSYTMKYDPERVSYPEFVEHLLHHQSRVRVCSVMPTEDTSAYEYLPEEAITKVEFEALAATIARGKEEVDREHLDCDGAACPVEWVENKGLIHEPGYA